MENKDDDDDDDEKDFCNNWHFLYNILVMCKNLSTPDIVQYNSCRSVFYFK